MVPSFVFFFTFPIVPAPLCPGGKQTDLFLAHLLGFLSTIKTLSMQISHQRLCRQIDSLSNTFAQRMPELGIAFLTISHGGLPLTLIVFRGYEQESTDDPYSQFRQQYLDEHSLPRRHIIYISGRGCPEAGPRQWTILPDTRQPICSDWIFATHKGWFFLPGTTTRKPA